LDPQGVPLNLVGNAVNLVGNQNYNVGSDGQSSGTCGNDESLVDRQLLLLRTFIRVLKIGIWNSTQLIAINRNSPEFTAIHRNSPEFTAIKQERFHKRF
jgi:hypothetical protein